MCGKRTLAGRAAAHAGMWAARATLLLTLLLAAAAPAAGQPLLPPAGGVLTGLTGGSYPAFESQVGKHPAVDGVFVTWGGDLSGAFGQAHWNHARLMLHISTAQGYGAPERITPAGIAAGAGDGYLLRLSASIAQAGAPVYIRLLPEMDQANNAYCAYSPDGSYRGAGHSPAAFRSAWRRVVLVLRGGPVAEVDARLARLGMAPLRGLAASAALPRLPVAFLWVPQSEGTPDTAANSPAAYWPGGEYVDWVGTDFYSLYPNFRGLEDLYRAYPGKPFVFGEWAMWGGDDPSWVDQLFGFIASHPRVRMALYNQGERSEGPFRLSHFPQARAEIRRRLSSARYLAWAPEWAPAAVRVPGARP